MTVTAIRGIRGATTVEADLPALIVEATGELLAELMRANDFGEADVTAAWFTTTPDLSSEFPAVAARRLGWVDVPLLCGQEMDVPDDNPRSVRRCIRVLILISTERSRAGLRFIYLRGARFIQEELERTRHGDLPTPATDVHGPRPSGVRRT